MALWGFLFVWSVVVCSPVMLVLLCGRRRIDRVAGCAALGLAFAAASSYKIWRVEWFDVWRHGTPGASLLFVYACYAAAYGAIGWFIARAILRSGSKQLRIGPQ